MKDNVILLEFNELCPSLMSRFIGQGHLPNFKKFSAESSVFVTEAEERAPYLDPWIQWVTAHTGLNFRDHGLEFVALMGRHVLSPSTLTASAQQLFSEVRGLDRWKRAVILDKLQFDVFQWYYKKIRPRFSTFFLNSTAHYQHFYWRNMEPEIFSVSLSPEEAAKYESAIL